MTDRVCTIDGCDSKHEALGFCRIHYRRFKKHGTPHLQPKVASTCSVDGCEVTAWARGWCRRHYKRWHHRGGDPAEHMRRRPLEERLRARLVPGGPNGECLEWTGATLKGYGQIGEDGTIKYAHRVAYELWVGPVEDGELVCHRCDNPPCCNPDHLFVGTPRDNMHDMIRKGRAWWQRGEP